MVSSTRKVHLQTFPLPACDMSITVEVGLLSGKTAAVKAAAHERVAELKHRAQIALEVGPGRLVDSHGTVLDASASIKQSGVQSGDSLTLHISRTQACGSSRAFAGILGDGRVATWGHGALGGDSRSIQDQSQDVQQIQASEGAFAAILGDGSVVTWG